MHHEKVFASVSTEVQKKMVCVCVCAHCVCVCAFACVHVCLDMCEQTPRPY